MINAVPPRYTSGDLSLTPGAKCRLCQSGQSGRVTQRWVLCPMVGGQPICYGCCLDYQGLARSLDFEDNPFRDDFDSLSRKLGIPVAELRHTCLGHQQDIVLEQLGAPDPAEDRRDLLELASHIAEALEDMST